jgi:DNA polymerase-3 subunit delta'
MNRTERAFEELSQHQPRVLSSLEILASRPPQTLLLEGGTPGEREGLALYWAALLNCPEDPGPCGTCAACRQIQAASYRDLFFFSGREGQIKIEQVREVRQVLGQRPDSGQARVVVFSEAQELTQAAANALLKSLEEPLPGNHFLLLAPQRSWLLPTLVSRSFVLTLRWSTSNPALEATAKSWRPRLLQFWRDGRGLFEHTGKKSAVDRETVQDVLGDCRAALRQLLAGQREHPMAAMWAESMPLAGAASIDRILSKGLEALGYQTTPSLVLDWVALQIWKRLRGLSD